MRGGHFQGSPVGCCLIVISVFSFHPVKIITSGEGGMATTNDPFWLTKWKSCVIMESQKMFSGSNIHLLAHGPMSSKISVLTTE